MSRRGAYGLVRVMSTTTSTSALATTARSTGSLSSGVRRQDAGPRLDAHDPGERVGAAGEVADDGHPVTDDDGPAAELARTYRRDERPGRR